MAKPAKQLKDGETRRREAEMILGKLEDIGIPVDALRPIAGALEEFVDRARGSTTTHKFPEYGVTVLLQLSVQPHITSFARLRRTPARQGAPV